MICSAAIVSVEVEFRTVVGGNRRSNPALRVQRRAEAEAALGHQRHARLTDERGRHGQAGDSGIRTIKTSTSSVSSPASSNEVKKRGIREGSPEPAKDRDSLAARRGRSDRDHPLDRS